MKKASHLKIKIINKRRFLTFIACMSLIIAITIITAASQLPVYGQDERNYINVNVISGDTLWSIAQKYKPENKDVRYFVYKIMKENHLKTAEIYENQNLRIPIH